MKVVTRLTPAAVVVVGSDSTGFPAGSVVNKYAIIGAGTGFLGLGFLLLIVLCACQKNTHRRRRPPPHLVQVGVCPSSSLFLPLEWNDVFLTNEELSKLTICACRHLQNRQTVCNFLQLIRGGNFVTNRFWEHMDILFATFIHVHMTVTLQERGT